MTTFDLRRFNAVRGYQAQQGREISRCLKELRALRREALAACMGEPEDTAAATLRNEPESPPEPANDHAPQTAAGASHPAGATPRNEPCLTRVWQKGEAPTPCRGWVRGVGDRNEPRGPARGLA